MSPATFKILCHYYISPSPYETASQSYHDETVRELVSDGMLEASTPQEQQSYGGLFKATEKAVFWINAVLSTPYPVSKWIIPVEPTL